MDDGNNMATNPNDNCTNNRIHIRGSHLGQSSMPSNIGVPDPVPTKITKVHSVKKHWAL
jgi:hypothetical protein